MGAPPFLGPNHDTRDGPHFMLAMGGRGSVSCLVPGSGLMGHPCLDYALGCPNLMAEGKTEVPTKQKLLCLLLEYGIA